MAKKDSLIICDEIPNEFLRWCFGKNLSRVFNHFRKSAQTITTNRKQNTGRRIL